jgi:WD40 repeat protein
MPQVVRIFISSPGDVPDERLRAELTIDKLAQEFRRDVELQCYRWEFEAKLASDHFQDAIEPPSKFDIVILILWSRLGTPLPIKTAVRQYRGIDDRAPVTGTEWEFEEALQAARASGTRRKPEILVFRNLNPARVDTLDRQSQARSIRQLRALNAFWERHFADRDRFLAAYDGYHTLEEFAKLLESSLRKLIERQRTTADGRAQRTWQGVPFRGLEAYEFEHQDIFFGRDATVTKATEHLAAQARAGTAFLLVSGASGSGKSSLVKAALMPRLMKPQRISGAEFVRRAIFRPADMRNDDATRSDIILAFVRSLTATSAEDETVGLPELLPPGTAAEKFAVALRAAGGGSGLEFAGALGQLTRIGRSASKLLGHEEAKLLLVVDQLEELFTIPEIDDDDRRLFVHVIDVLARSGAVWVIATMRADFWHRAAELPELIALCDGERRIEILSPSPTELGEMIRGPAKAAGLTFEVQGNKSLDDIIADDAAHQPGVLPLLSFVLKELYAEDVEKRETEPHNADAGGGPCTAEATIDSKAPPSRTLTFATYKSAGGLAGAIAKQADKIVAGLAPEAQAELSRVLRSLATVQASERSAELPVSRAVPLASFPPATHQYTLLKALIDSRLVVAATEGTTPTVRLAHEALISGWQTAREHLTAAQRDLGTRALIERQFARWAGSPPPEKPQLLLRDPDLASALDLDRRWGDELGEDLRKFIAESHAAARAAIRRWWMVAAAVMAGLTVLTVASIGGLYIAENQRNDALIAQSRFLARDSQIATAEGNATLGALLALEALPRNLATPDRPFVKQSEYALENAMANWRERGILPAHNSGILAASLSPDGNRVLTAAADGGAQVEDADGGRIVKLNALKGPLIAAAFSPDGTRVVTGADDGSVIVSDAGTGGLVTTLRGHTGSITSAAFSRDGMRVVTASEDKTARVWNVETGVQITKLSGHRGLVNTALFSPDGNQVLTSSTDNTARLWDVASKSLIHELTGHTDFVMDAAFSPDGTRIVTASWDRTARIWNAADGQTVLELSGHEDKVHAAAFSRDGKRVVTASSDKTARVWDATTAKPPVLLHGHEHVILAASFSPDDKYVLTASADGTARLWDAEFGAMIGVLRGERGAVHAASFSPKGERILTAADDGIARLWDTEPASALPIFRQHGDTVNSIAISPDGKRVATASWDHKLRLWPIDGEVPIAVGGEHTGVVRSVAFSSDGRMIVTASDDDSVRLWDGLTGAHLRELHRFEHAVWFARFSPDDRQVVVASTDKVAFILDAQTGAEIGDLRGHEHYVTTASFSPDGRRLVTSSWDKTVRVWEPGGGSLLKPLAHDGRVAFAAFSPNGKRIVTASDDKMARIWDATTGELIATLVGHESWVHSALFSPDGKRVVTASEDRTLRTWDSETGAAITVFRGHGERVRIATFSPDGKEVWSGAGDKVVRAWNMPPRCQSLIDLALRRKLRGLSSQERDRFFLGEEQSAGSSFLGRLDRWLAMIVPRSREVCE